MKAIITVGQYERLTNQKLEESKKEFVKILINVVSDMIESHIGYDLEKQDRIEIIQKNIKINRFWVKYPPINSVISVFINEKAVKTELVLAEIAKAEEIKATDEEVAKEIETLAAMYGLEKDALIADVRKNGNYERFIDETNYRLVNQKTIDLLVNEAKVK